MDEVYKRLNDDLEFVDHSGDPSEIQEFFAGQTIFLTGSTGYVGKVLVEKLLRSCPDLKKIYFLVRAKKQTPAERMKKYFDDLLFDRLKEEVPDCKKKIAFVEGDLIKDHLGLSPNDRAKLIEETTIIYHNASNVKFDEKIKVSIRTNVFATRFMLELAKECKKLLGFVYVSTAFSHTHMQQIDDKFYPPPVEMNVLDDILAVDEASPRGIDEEAMKQFRGPWPNNYAFTKSIAESLIEKCGKEANFALAVFRPSIIISTKGEPIQAWCANMNGPVGVVVGAAIGFLHALPYGIYPVDFTPADMCTNALITCTWDSIVNKREEKEAIVYNYASSVENPISLRQFCEQMFERGQDIGTTKMMGGCWVMFPKCIYYYWFLHILLHLLPAILADGVLLMKGQKPQVVNAWKLLTKNLHSLMFYVNGNWRIQVPNMRKIWKRLNPRDAKLFNSNLQELNWPEYMIYYWAGLRTYLLKDPMETAEKAGRSFRRMRFIQTVIYNLVQALIIFFVARWMYPNLFSCPFA